MALDYTPPPKITTELIINKSDLSHSGVNDHRYSLVVVLDDTNVNIPNVNIDPKLIPHLKRLTICLKTIFPLPNGDSFSIGGNHITYYRKLSGGSTQKEIWNISLFGFSGSIPSVAHHVKGWSIGPGLLTWNELAIIFSHISLGKSYDRKRDLTGESHILNLKVFQ